MYSFHEIQNLPLYQDFQMNIVYGDASYALENKYWLIELIGFNYFQSY